jgi:uncharacterized protein (TIGR00159 family)
VTDLVADLFQDSSATDILFACLDIFLVYYVLYRILLTIKGTRAAQMVIGIVLIGIAFFAAERFRLTTVSWLLDNFIEYFIILVIVVFQQDIRRALTRIGQNVSRFGRTHEIRHALDEVVDAAEHLAKARIGGIVVFEREVPLDEFLDHGEQLDARVSKELLVTLFVPSRDNDLHDGAVIMKNLRIDRAGAVLPLSRSQMAASFGTRHRASLGITEETDAVSVVISEERGEISLCFRGNIARDLETETLRRVLRGLFYSGERDATALAREAQAAAAIAKAVAALGEDKQPIERTERGDEASTTMSMRQPRPTRLSETRRAATSRPAEEPGGG